MKKKSIVMYMVIVAATVFIVDFFTDSKPVEASQNVQREKVVISVLIEEGDTLWSIASEYYTDDYVDMNEFIHDIKACNGISDQIKIGQKILIPCYRIIL